MKGLIDILVVFLGSGAGGAARYVVSRLAKTHVGQSMFPWETLAVNVVGCFIIGIIYGYSGDCRWLSDRVKLLLAVGFCGGFTTFSTFANENYTLLSTSNLLLSSIYIATSVIVGIAATTLGYHIAR